MSQKHLSTIKPYCSIVILMTFLFVFAFIQMENRRRGYSFLQLTVKEKALRSQQRIKLARLAKMKGPERVRLLATQRLPMKRAASGQVIQMTSSGSALIQ